MGSYYNSRLVGNRQDQRVQRRPLHRKKILHFFICVIRSRYLWGDHTDEESLPTPLKKNIESIDRYSCKGIFKE